MQSRKCEYCGVIQDHTTNKCLNCGGLLKQSATSILNLSNKKGLSITLLFIILVISPLAYQKHIENTSNAIIKSLQPGIGKPDMQASIAKDFMMKAKFVQVLVNVSHIKMLITEHYATTGSYPGTLKELGLDESSFEPGNLMQAVHLSEKGSIQVLLAADNFGNNKTLTLTPKLTMGGMNIQWICTSNLEQHLIPDVCNSGT